MTRLLIEHQVKASLPPQTITPFSGDILAYTSFMKSFEHGVEQKTTNYNDLIYYLDQYTSGEDNTLVKSCLHYKYAKEGYERAKDLLRQRYGNSHRIAEAFLKRAENWPEIKKEDAKDLNKFAQFLIECKNLMDSAESLHELNHTKSLQMLVSKLPYNLRSSWRTIAYVLEEERARAVTFADLVGFVDRQARIASNPTFGTLAVDSRQKDQGRNQRSQPSRRHAFATNAKDQTRDKTNNTKSCTYCEGESKHVILECRKFAKLEPNEKSDSCFSKGLCFGCLEVGYTKSSCPNPDVARCSQMQRV